MDNGENDGVYVRDTAYETEEHHVMFLDTQDIDGTGRLSLDNHDRTSSPAEAHRPKERLLGDAPMMESPNTSSVNLPREPLDGFRGERRDSFEGPRNKGEEPLPVSAETPQEMERSSAAELDGSGMNEKKEENGLLAARLERKESIVPEGKGTKRLYQLSKRFSAFR